MADDVDAEHVVGLALVPVGGRPDLDHAGHGLAVVDPGLHADAAAVGDDRQEVVVEREPLRLAGRQRLQPLRHRCVQVTAGAGADVAGHALPAPAQVVDRGDVREEVVAQGVAQVQPGGNELGRLDDDRCLAVRLVDLDEAGNRLERHSAHVAELTSRRSAIRRRAARPL